MTMFVKEMYDNVCQGNIGSACVDAGGAIVDLATFFIPCVPGGVSTGINVCRHGDEIADLAEEARRRYPKKAGKIEEHHIDPKYLGGDPEGPTVPLEVSYHQLITNEFRDLQPYCTGPVSPERLEELKNLVYEKYPIPQ